MPRSSKPSHPARRRLIAGAALTCLSAAVPAHAQDAQASFGELYKKIGPLGIEFSDKLRALNGKRVRFLGYMAPPLKAEARFFVLTRAPVSICPFCSSDADWPTDIVVVYMKDRIRFSDFGDGTAVAVAGILELGSKTDADTGFVSMVRLVNAEVVKL